MANLTYSGGAHTIKTGFDMRRRHMGEFQTNRGNGRFNFSPNITNNPANNSGGQLMASFLLGAPSLIEQDYLLADVAIRGTEYGIYVADDWRVSDKLTLNLGLRYELDTPYSEASNQWARFDPETATVQVAGRNGVSETAGVNTFYKAFAPRFGFAYQLAAEHRGARRRRASSGTRRATAATPCGCTATCPSGRSTASTRATSSSRRRVSDGFPTIPPLNLALADNPAGQRHRRRSGLSAGLRRRSST